MLRIDLEGLDRARIRLDRLVRARLDFKAVNAAARAYRDDVAKTLRQQERKSRIPVRWRFDGAGAMTYTKATHASRIEYGTGIHGPFGKTFGILPRRKKVLKLPGGVFVRRVERHPGSPARPFFYIDRDARLSRLRKAAQRAIDQAIREKS